MNRMHSILRVGLFILIVSLGTGITLLFGEIQGAALADLSNAPVKILVETTYGDTLYATLSGEARGLYRSADRGYSWQKISSEPDGLTIDALAIHPTNERLLFANAGGVLWQSQDTGQTWQRYNASVTAGTEGRLPTVTTLTVDPNHPGVLYVGTAGQGVYRVRSGYAGFEPVGGPSMHDLYVKDIVIVPESEVYAITTEGLWVIKGDSLDKLETLPDAPVSLAVDPTQPQILYAGTVGYGAHRSTDDGQTWQAINTGLGLEPGIILRVSAIALDEDNPDHLALAKTYGVGHRLVGDGIYESFDAGQHWTKVAENQEVITHLTIERGKIYVATAGGLKQYGESLTNTPSRGKPQLESSTNLTGVQIVILAGTIVLAGLILLGRIEWLVGWKKVESEIFEMSR